ncbi:MAG: pantoate--beta-alanine ligase [Candidatus Omnitrophica bacterium]|jgi:pantoate--beta-alanine ligase|nr:pantoate--beta-alanine ligase [Candidatus Omnitrophota bacterium]
MKIIRDPEKISIETGKNKQLKKRIGFVPTMGALHPGHFSLISRARKENDIVAVSIFVNPAQFGKGEDFKKYPRRFKQDIESCRRLGVDLVFLPDRDNMYPEGYSTFVNVDNLSDCLCGASRPGHFRGVATVVAKLLNILHPDALYLGQKDAQQAIIISRMVKDLNFPVKVKVLPTVRQEDGLALSSRNAYLNKQERSVALVLSKALRLAETLIRNGQRNCGRIISRMRQLIEKNRPAKIDYIAIIDPEQLKELRKIEPGCLIALAVKIGKVRLIDNTVIGRV